LCLGEEGETRLSTPSRQAAPAPKRDLSPLDAVDLRSCLKSWPYDADKNVHTTRGTDGREIILVRLPMGLEQYEVDGRPDGWRVHGMDTALSFHEARINAAKQIPSARISELTAEDCAELFDEAKAYLQRLNLLFRLKNWTCAERDAAQVLRLLGFIREHARCAEGRVLLDVWRPHATRIHAVARAMRFLDLRQYQDAFQVARDALGIATGVYDSASGHAELGDALLESVRSSLANHPSLHPHEESSFIRNNDYWTIRYYGHTVIFKSTRGLHCLVTLLRSPKREFHVCELLASTQRTPVTPLEVTASARLREDGDLCIRVGLNGNGPILDERAKAEYKRRLDELRQERDESELFNDPDRAAKAQVEMDAIARHLACAIGLGGRDRKTSSDAERARCAVTKRIKQAIQKIKDSIPSLGDHLSMRIKTGHFCSYTPDPHHPVAWKF